MQVDRGYMPAGSLMFRSFLRTMGRVGRGGYCCGQLMPPDRSASIAQG